VLTPSEFWNEIGRFQEINNASPGTYAWFTLVSTGLSGELMPLVNGLRRVRGLYAFYEDGSGIRHNSFDDYVRAVKKLGRTDQEAHFLFEKVLIEADLSTAQSHGEALFGQALVEHLPSIGTCPLGYLERSMPILGRISEDEEISQFLAQT